MRIVFALDDSNDSMSAAHALARLPFREKPHITVVTALTSTPFDLVKSEKGVELHAAEKEVAEKNFQLVQSILADKCEACEFVLENKHPNRLIMDVAKKHKADLIVLGARGHSAAYRAVLGSTADFVVNHAQCSVLLVRPKTMDDKDGFRVLLGYDGSPQSQLAAEQLQAFDWPADGTQLHVAMMLERPKLVPEEVVYDENLVAESNQALVELVQKANLKCPVTQSVRETLHIGNAVVRKAENEETDLLFVGGTGKSALMQFFLGSTSRFILHHAKCSVWVAKETHWH